MVGCLRARKRRPGAVCSQVAPSLGCALVLGTHIEPKEVIVRCSLALLLVPVCMGCGGEDRDAQAEAGATSAADTVPPLLDLRFMSATAPPRLRARFETSEGAFVLEVHRDWSPRGADRFYNLVRAGYYDSVYVHRVIPGGIAQFGFHPDARINNLWLRRYIGDDPLVESNTRGRVTFAHAGLNTRSTQVFINLVDNPQFDDDRFVPFGEVVEGMEAVDALYDGYGELAPEGEGPDPRQAAFRGNAYLQESFPLLSQILTATIEDVPGP